MAKITKETIISDVMQQDVNAAKIFIENGLHCFGCPSAAGESLEQACEIHGIDVDKLVGDLNMFFGE